MFIFFFDFHRSFVLVLTSDVWFYRYPVGMDARWIYRSFVVKCFIWFVKEKNVKNIIDNPFS